MFTELWIESRQLHKIYSSSSSETGTAIGEGYHLHNWLFPFSGFLHAEKQAMYSLCKEMLDGLGLEEMEARA